MMSLCWILAVLLVLLTPDLFPSRSLLPPLTHASPTYPPVTPHQILFITDVGSDDYDDDYTDGDAPPPSPSGRGRPPPTATSGPAPEACSYDPCLEEQVPCAQLSAQQGCLCPGLSRASEPPRPPALRALVPVVGDDPAEGGVEAQWCAPESEVSGYQVAVEGRRGAPLSFGEARRRAALGELEAGTRVCVAAVNEAGVSEPSGDSCLTYDPPERPNLALRAGVLVGGAGFLLLLSLAAVVLWRRQSCAKARKDSTEGLGNPSYSAGGTL